MQRWILDMHCTNLEDGFRQGRYLFLGYFWLLLTHLVSAKCQMAESEGANNEDKHGNITLAFHDGLLKDAIKGPLRALNQLCSSSSRF